MSNNSNTVYNAPADLKSKVWTKVWPYVRSVEQLLSTVVARQIWKLTWWDNMEIYASNEGSVDANVSNVTASTCKNTDRKSTRLNSSHSH